MTLTSFTNSEKRVLLLSLRNTQNFFFNSCLYEFEDIIAEVDIVDLLNPSQYTLQGDFIKKLLRHQNKIFTELVNFNPYPDAFFLENEYDLLLITIDLPWSILSLNYLKNWRKKMQNSCLLSC